MDILYAIADGNYTEVYLTGGRVMKVLRKLKEVEQLLSGGNFLRIYKNGELIGENTANPPQSVESSGSLSARIGARGGADVFDGLLDDIRIYNRTLSHAEVMAVYELGNDNGSSLVGHWKLDELSGTTASDSSGNGNNGTLNNFAAPPPWSSSGQVNGTLKFEDNDDRILIPNDASTNITNEITLSGWFKIDTFNGYSRLMGKLAANDYLMEITGGGNLCFTIFSVTAHCGTGTISTGQWHHVATTYNDATNTIRLYIDGVLDDTITTTDTISASGSSVSINDNGSTGWFGHADDLRVYNRELSATEIDALYKLGTGNCTNPEGKEGDLIMDDLDAGVGVDNALIYCDGVNWQTIGKTP